MTQQRQRSRVLVVDDDPSILRTVGRILERDHDVELVSSGAEALQSLNSFRPDVAIVDIRMPEMDGLQLMQRFHAQRPELDVIVMTGTADEPDANLVQAIVAGAFYFVQKPFDRRVLLTLVTRCLELRRLREEKERYVRALEQDLDDARRFQTSLLPDTHAQIGGLTIDAQYVACHELAGDFFDYAALDSQHVAIVIADVVGHGTAAAMLTSIVKSAFHAALINAYDPARVITGVKEGVRALDPGRFITVCAAEIALAEGRLTYANAGHPPVLLQRAGNAPVLLDSTGPLVSSAFLEMPCGSVRVPVQAGDLLLFYTDGVTDVHGPEGIFGMERVSSIVSQSKNRGAALLDELLAAASQFAAGRPSQDDMTLLAAQLGRT
jgi:sigma-B regulation protein RsbU (phosphoserine phosphatase)